MTKLNDKSRWKAPVPAASGGKNGKYHRDLKKIK